MPVPTPTRGRAIMPARAGLQRFSLRFRVSAVNIYIIYMHTLSGMVQGGEGMGPGDKKSGYLFRQIEKKGELTKSANPTKIGTIRRKGGEDKKWVQKTLSSRQEVLVECITGEIYRYLIGEHQPKIRTGGENVILSEFVPYRSVRDVFDVTEHHSNIARFKEAFLMHLDGFMRVLFSSIFMEENDLSDQNYGLTILKGAEIRDEDIEDEDFVNIVKAPEEYGEFIKIDHGQSLNSLRINESGFRSLAEIKYFPPPIDADIDAQGLDKRTKKQRETIWFTKRKYLMDPIFVDRIVLHFLLGCIDRPYIEELKFQPSALPLYDGRLLTFFKGWPDKTDACEAAKHQAIAKIVFTKDELMRKIGSLASHQSFPGVRGAIIEKIIANKDAFFMAVRTDPDFCVFCHVNKNMIQDEIEKSHRRMIYKRPKLGREPERSERYYQGLSAVNPVDVEKLNAIAAVGQCLANGDTRSKVQEAIIAIRDIIATHNWNVKGAGGETVKITRTQMKRLPETAVEMFRSLVRYRLSPAARCYRTLTELAYLSYLAQLKSSFWRSKETQQGYVNILSKLTSLAQTHPVVDYILDKYNEKDAEPFLDYYKLSRELTTKAPLRGILF
jgi:hypothetical protein